MRRQSNSSRRHLQANLLLLGFLLGLLLMLTACGPPPAISNVEIDPTFATVSFYTPIPGTATATGPPPTATRVPTVTPTPSPTATPAFVRFAVIGGYGTGNRSAEAVANLVKSWQPEFIVTTGGNNFYHGAAETIDENVGKFYFSYIHPYVGEYGQGADVNRFFPAMGSYDWEQSGAQPYLDYFTLPGNERYYDVRWQSVRLFILNSHSRETDGTAVWSEQARWLRTALAASDAPWKVVVAHHSPYSSGRHGSYEPLRWPFRLWGAAAVLSGDANSYERLMVDRIPYFLNGLGGGRINQFDPEDRLPWSILRFDEEHGALLVVASDEQINFRFVTVSGRVIDQHAIQK